VLLSGERVKENELEFLYRCRLCLRSPKRRSCVKTGFSILPMPDIYSYYSLADPSNGKIIGRQLVLPRYLLPPALMEDFVKTDYARLNNKVIVGVSAILVFALAYYLWRIRRHKAENFI